MFMSVSRIEALLRMGALIDKTHAKVGAYSEGGAYWREGPKSIRIVFITECRG